MFCSALFQGSNVAPSTVAELRLFLTEVPAGQNIQY